MGSASWGPPRWSCTAPPPCSAPSRWPPSGVRTVYLLTETAAQFFLRLGFRPITRADVDSAVLRSTEFTTAYPASALVMVKPLTADT